MSCFLKLTLVKKMDQEDVNQGELLGAGEVLQYTYKSIFDLD